MKAERAMLRSDATTDPTRLMRSMNDILIAIYERLEALEGAKGVTALEPVQFTTGAAVTPTSAPFSLDSGGLRVSCPFTPTGLVLLRLENLTSSATPSSANDVKWHYVTSPAGLGSDGTLVIDFVTGLAVNSSYRMTLGVTRG